MGGDFAAIVGHLLAAVPRQSRVLVAIDGVGGSGKSTFAGRLAQHIDERPVVVLHVDDFFNPTPIRHAKGRESPEGFWLDAFNYEALISWALTPLAAEGDGLYRPGSYDHAGDQIVGADPLQAPSDALVLIEGIFLHRDELRRFWDFSVFLDVPFLETARRMAQRDGLDADPERGLMRRYVGGQRAYFREAAPWERASLVVDNTDVDNPRIIDAAAVRAAL